MQTQARVQTTGLSTMALGQVQIGGKVNSRIRPEEARECAGAVEVGVGAVVGLNSELTIPPAMKHQV
jgi:hypothetical protein